MKSHRNFIVSGAAALAVVALIAAAAPISSRANANDRTAVGEDATARQDKMREHLQARLDHMAKRLNIETAQQGAWNAYVQTARGMIGPRPQRPAADADAATVVRFRAQLAAAHAQKLAQLADATATLQQALRPEQRRVLDEMVRHPEHRRFGHQEPVRG
jgi:hypothetical protein